MGIDVTARTIIKRPRDEVAAFLENPANDLAWIRALTSSHKLTEGPIAVGMKVERVARMMGRAMTYTTEVVGYERGRLLEMATVAGPFPMQVAYTFEDAGAGTAVSVRNRGGAGMAFLIAGPLIGWMVNSRVKGDLKALNRALSG